jgi:hypothetical protein
VTDASTHIVSYRCLLSLPLQDTYKVAVYTLPTEFGLLDSTLSMIPDNIVCTEMMTGGSPSDTVYNLREAMTAFLVSHRCAAASGAACLKCV